MRMCIIVPLYNEGNRFNSDYFNNIKMKNLDFIFVNDGSKDDTLIKINNLSFKKHVISYKENKGKGEAIRLGIKYAISKKYQLIGYLDSDGAFSASSVIKIIESAKIEFSSDSNLGMVIASRVNLSGRKIIRTRSRKIISNIVKIILSLILTNKPYDTQSGFKIIKNTKILKDVVEKKFKTSWFFDVELIEAIRKKYKVYEIPVDNWEDIKGSKINYKQSLKILNEIKILIKLYR